MSAIYSTQRLPVSSFWTVFALGLMPAIHASIVNETCGSWDSDTVLCINSYGNVLPGNFSRQVSASAAAEDTLASVSVLDDSTFPSINNATFLVFDAARSLEILGDSPTYELMFTTPAVNHEAPVYVPDLNHLYFTQVAQGVLTQALIDLNPDTPTLEYVLADPPIYAPTGGQYHNGLIYWSTTGSNATEDGYVARPGIYTFDPKTNKSETLLNNYFGYFFNGADDIAIESNGDIWFTDDDYGWLDSTSINTPMLPTATYRFRPSTGAVQLVNTALSQPNGIRFSPSGDKLYLTDTGAVSGTLTGSIQDISVTYSSTGPRVMYVFDVIKASNATDAPSTIVNGRPIYLSQDWVPDGLQVARNGWLATATGHGVDVLDDTGVLLLRIQTPFKVGSINFAGDDLKDLWIVGAGYIARVRWELQGQELV